MSTEESKLNVQGYNIVTILKRLETATSRLEDITMIQEEAFNNKEAKETKGSSNVSGVISQKVPETKQLSTGPEKTKSTVNFEQFVDDLVKPVIGVSSKIDSVVGEQATKLYEAFQAEVEFLHIASQCQKPDYSDPKFTELLKSITEKIEAIGAIKDANRTSKYFNHLNTFAEGAPVLGWIVNDKPVSLIPEFKDSAQFWSNRIIKEYKDADQIHVEWVKTFLQLFDALRDYVKEFHTTGVRWNKNGQLLSDYSVASSNKPETTNSDISSGAPPPPPPPPANLYDEPPNEPKSTGGMNAVFAELNKGENITSVLKKVDKSQMNHKNPDLKKAPLVSKKPLPPKKPTSLSASSPPKKPAKKDLVDGSKWIIENYTKLDLNGEDSIIINAEMHQSIFIGNCNHVTIQIKDKANVISVSNCDNVAVVIDSLISGIDIIKSRKFGLQVLGTVADISVDQSEEVTVYLSQKSIDANTQVYSSSTTTLNINVPTDDDYVELPAPEQFRHFVKDGKLVSEVVEHVA